MSNQHITSFMTGALFAGVLAFVTPAHADLKLPKPSPKASVTQQIGLTDVTVTYSSPAVNSRTIWGELVPYGKVWRTGANECTKFSASTDFEVGGKKLTAGDYCLATIPAKDNNWIVILNTDSAQSGSYKYDESKDAIRFNVKATPAPFRERLAFDFDEVTKSSANVRLHWEKLAVAFPIKVSTNEYALKNINEMSSKAWMDHAQAARYLLEEEKNPAEALKHIDESIQLEKTWFNHWIKASVLEAQGNKSEALKFATEAKELGDDSSFYKAFAAEIDSGIKRLDGN